MRLRQWVRRQAETAAVGGAAILTSGRTHEVNLVAEVGTKVSWKGRRMQRFMAPMTMLVGRSVLSFHRLAVLRDGLVETAH